MDDDSDQEEMYRIQLLQAFDLNEWNDAAITTTITELYAKLSCLPIFTEIFLKARENQYIIEMLDLIQLSGEDNLDDDVIFHLLFKFEFFDLLHRCIVDYLINNTIHEKYSNQLLDALE
jgi:hypothetical protein